MSIRLKEALDLVGLKGVLERTPEGLRIVPNLYHTPPNETSIDVQAVTASDDEWNEVLPRLRLLTAESVWRCGNAKTTTLTACAPKGFNWESGFLGYKALGLPDGEYYLHAQ